MVQNYQILFNQSYKNKNLKKIFFPYKYFSQNLTVVYFDQLSGAGLTQKLVKILFPAVFNLFPTFKTFFSEFLSEIT